MNLYWFIPLHGDGRYLGTAKGARAIDFPYVRQIAQAADRLGYQGVLLPTGKGCEDSWIVASSLISSTEKLRFLVAVRPGVMTPTQSARMATTLDRFSGGRVLVNVVTGGDPVELKGEGLFQSHQERYAITDEFLDVWQKIMAGETVDYEGEHIHVEGAELLYHSLQRPYPPIFFGGSSDAAIELSGKYVECFLTWGEPLKDVEEKINKVKAAAAKYGREVKFGIRLHIIVRETEEEAWTAADKLIEHISPELVEEAKKIFARYDSVGQKRMQDLNTGKTDRESLTIAPNLWAGIGLIRGGAGTALVGSPEQVAERLKEYAALGIENFILSGYPHLEEAYRVKELLFPLLPVAPQLGGVKHTEVNPVGELIAYARPVTSEPVKA